MKKIILIIFGLILLIGGGLVLFIFNKKEAQGQAILKIDSSPQAKIFFDDEDLGKTPYEGKVASGEHTVKLVPEASDVVTWENKMNFRANLITYIKRDLGNSELTSGGDILFLEKNSQKKAELAVISTPSEATVTLDGTDVGMAPQVVSDKEAGNYELSVSLTGYISRSIKIKTTDGYKLNAVFQLASSTNQLTLSSPVPSESPSPSSKSSPKTSSKPTASSSASASLKPKGSPPAKPYVEVLNTDTGYLNVRSEPSTGAEILVKIYPGEYYAYVDEQKSGDRTWYKIKYNALKIGWISAQYAKKFE